jgi:hypothetical protein
MVWMVYSILAERWPGKATYHARLEAIRIDGVGGFATLFTCQHQHRKAQTAYCCADALAARDQDRDTRLLAEQEAEAQETRDG